LQQQFIVVTDNLDIFLPFLNIFRLNQQIREADNGIQRSTDFMAHISEESTFQTACHFCPVTCQNQFRFRLFQFRDVVVDTYDFNFILLGPVISHHNIRTHPVPLVYGSHATNTHFFLKMASVALLHFLIEVENISAIIRMHVAVDTNNFAQRRIFLLSHILIPLFNGISFPTHKVQLGIPHFGIIGNQQEEILEVADAVYGINTFGIINVNQYISAEVPFIVI